MKYFNIKIKFNLCFIRKIFDNKFKFILKNKIFFVVVFFKFRQISKILNQSRLIYLNNSRSIMGDSSITLITIEN